MVNGGEGGIRTHGNVAGTPHFECGAFDHSATSPQIKTVLAGGPAVGRSRPLAATDRLAKPILARLGRAATPSKNAPAWRIPDPDVLASASGRTTYQA